MNAIVSLVIASLAAGAAPAAAQTAAAAQTPPPAQTPSTPAPAEQRTQSRFQISQLERLLAGAVEHGATLFRQRFQAALPSQLLITENARVRGFPLEGYGVFFDVEVPGIEGSALAPHY